jgi:hypothetical protein|tara:strand:- start:165 stop:419 length:255 start_codon:yes stop_codon:yes gene_type:complete
MNEEIRLDSFEQFFDGIKNIWARLEQQNTIIPFCTPLMLNPTFLVIGTNHSNNFCPYNSLSPLAFKIKVNSIPIILWRQSFSLQ